MDASPTRQYCIKTWKNVDLSLNMPLSGYIICIMASYHGRLRLHLVLISVQLYWFCQHCDWTSVCMFFFNLVHTSKYKPPAHTEGCEWSVTDDRWRSREQLYLRKCASYIRVFLVFLLTEIVVQSTSPLILWFKHFSLAHLFQGLWFCTRCCSTFSSS